MKKFLIIVLLVFSPLLKAETAGEQLSALLQKTASIKADFVQNLLNERGKAVNTSYGNFVLQRPDKFYWLISSPSKQIIINDGKKIWNYQPDLAQVEVKPVSQAIAATPLAILSGSTVVLQRDFAIEQVDENTFKLTAKKSGTFKYVWLYFKDGVINAMKLQDALGQATQLQFSHVATNVKISADTFKFTPPQGVDVIDSM